MSLLTTTTIPWFSIIGGCCVGLAAGILLLANGDVMGESGILSSVILSPRKTFEATATKWKFLFVSSFILTAFIISTIVETPAFIQHKIELIMKQRELPIPLVSNLGFAMAGLMVGFGAELGDGCHSGHGICGLARFSKRSFAAVVTFMTTSILTTTLVSSFECLSQYLRVPNTESNLEKYFPNSDSKLFAVLFTTASVAASIPVLLGNWKETGTVTYSTVGDQNKTESKARSNAKIRNLVAIMVASLFCCGLITSGLTRAYKVFNFLDIRGVQHNKSWDPTLVYVMASGLLVSTLAYQFVKGYDKIIHHGKTLQAPMFPDTSTTGSIGTFHIPTNTAIDKQLIVGSAIYGIGWGIAGLCPATALCLIAAGYPQVLSFWGPANIIGSFFGDKAKLFI